MADEQDTDRTDGLSLALMITALRRELEDAQQWARGEDLQFGIADIEVEATVQITRNVSGGGGVQFWVVQARGDYGHGSATTHRIKLNLTLPPTVRISDEEEKVE